MVDAADQVCGQCGVPVAIARGGPVHIDQLPEHVEFHDVFEVVTRKEYLFGRQREADANPGLTPPLERQARAQERIADVLERIADVLERIADALQRTL